MMISAHHVYLIAPGASFDDIRRFYGQGLGLGEVPKPASLAHVSVLWFDAGALHFHIGYPAQGTVGEGHTALAVADVESMRLHMLEMGYAVDDTVIPMGYPRFYVQDSWGNQFEILPLEIN